MSDSGGMTGGGGLVPLPWLSQQMATIKGKIRLRMKTVILLIITKLLIFHYDRFAPVTNFL